MQEIKQLNMYVNRVYVVFLLCLIEVYSDNKNNSTIFTEVKYHQNDSFIIHDKRIKNGYTIDIFYANYYVFVECDGECGGTLVRQNKVITAAHCVDKCAVKNFHIAVGLNALSELPKARKYKAKSIQIHPKFKKQPRPYDVAVITLAKNVELNLKVGTINYANSIPPVGSWLCIYGYGFINTNGGKPKKLQKAAVNVIDRKRSIIYTQALMSPSILKGDSGGPVLYNNQLAAITSAYEFLNNVLTRNVFVAVGHPEIFSFILKYAP